MFGWVADCSFTEKSRKIQWIRHISNRRIDYFIKFCIFLYFSWRKISRSRGLRLESVKYAKTLKFLLSFIEVRISDFDSFTLLVKRIKFRFRQPIIQERLLELKKNTSLHRGIISKTDYIKGMSTFIFKGHMNLGSFRQVFGGTKMGAQKRYFAKWQG